MPRCRVCGKSARYFVPWTNAWFCEEHFTRYVERVIQRTYDKYIGGGHHRILFAISGGKDSVTLLHSLIPKLRDRGREVSVLFIDLGISGYSDKALKIVEENASMLNIDLVIARLENYGFTIDDVARLYMKRLIRRPVCSICGLVKRYLMNRIAYEKGFDLVLTGHTLDDVLAFSMINILSGNLYELTKLKPYNPGGYKLVARGKPLILTYEAETRWYVEAKNLPVLDVKCPYTPFKEGLVFEVKNMFYKLEENHPGIMRMYMRNLIDKLIPSLEKVVEKPRLVYCSICGMPASTDPCSFCRIRRKIVELRNKV
jgi:uncharacterized protein (TIGR00269 family)